MDDIFGQKPNMPNLIKFFKNEAIQALWGPSNESMKEGFNQSEHFRQIMEQCNPARRVRLIKML